MTRALEFGEGSGEAARSFSGALEALAALCETAYERIERSTGFLASVDPEATEAYRASGLPEVIGVGPKRNGNGLIIDLVRIRGRVFVSERPAFVYPSIQLPPRER